MYKKLSKSREIIARLQEEGKVTPMNSKEDLERISEMNKFMEKVRWSFVRKIRLSEISASKVILNT